MSNAQSVTHRLLTDAQSLANQQLPPSQVLWSCCSVGHHRVLGQFGSAVWVLSLPRSLLRLRSAWHHSATVETSVCYHWCSHGHPNTASCHLLGRR